MDTTAMMRKVGSGQALLIGVAGMLFAMTSQAGQPTYSSTAKAAVVVRYGDLNLSTAQGTRVLYARLTQAASQVCGGEPAMYALRQYQIYAACYDSALDKAVKKVDSERLQALHTERKSPRSVG